MRNKQSGFTLVEIAIVLVIIGLLLGGVLKGQELINSAKVKNMAVDFRNIPVFIYGYQDKYKALPGDHATAATVITGAANAVGPATTGNPAVACNPNCRGNGVIDGVWNSAGNTVAASTETEMFWSHIRLAGFAAGPTSITDASYYPVNADGGRIGIESGSAATGGPYISGLTPTYLVCSSGILGKYAKQLDTTLDDGDTATGSVRVVPNSGFARGGAASITSAVTD
ncbi:MAG: prepilin-type N-terminal cleavage/methylation domain-containing protein, partial [Sulfuritalea sp.]|nr:prepilin-type N-terminal cleavage/methylation domain-containing protein [Sulfuritalea sp.]